MEITYWIEVEQDDMPVRGNAVVSEDAEQDREIEDEIIERLNNGDVWAWASVRVVAQYKGFEGHAYLGGCCYDDEQDFINNSGYYEDMCIEAKEDLLKQLKRASKAYSELSRTIG